MIHILLLILKILGIVILAVLGLLLILLLLIFLVPVRYRGSGGYHGKPDVHVRITWLLHLISVRIRYRRKLFWEFRLFGVRIAGSRRRRHYDAPDAAEEPDAFPAEDTEPAMAGNPVPEMHPTAVPETESYATANEFTEEDERELEKELSAEIEEDRAERAKSSHRRKNRERKTHTAEHSVAGDREPRIRALVTRLSIFCGKICSWFRDTKNRYEEAREKIARFLEVLEDEENQKTAKLLIRQILKLLRNILPRKVSGKLAVGLDDPAYLGKVLMALSFVWPAMAGNLDVEPHFEGNYFEAEGEFAGHIRLGTVLVTLGRLLFDRNCRTWIKKALER